MNELRLTKEDLKQSVEKAKTEVKEVSKKEIKEYVKQAAQIINENESAFSKERLVEVALRLSMSQATNERVISVQEVEKAIKDLQHSGYLINLSNGYMTTKEMKNIEKQVIDYIQKTNGTAQAIEVSKEKIEQAIKEFEAKVGYRLTNDQKNAVIHIMQAKDRTVGIQGDAGTGKTTVFQLVKEELEKRGYTVRGITPTGKASDVMSRESGIKTQTVDSFLMNFRNMKIVDNKQEYIKQYNELNKKFEEKNWTTPPRLLKGGIWDKIFGNKTETIESQIKNFLEQIKQELGFGKKEEKLNWFETKVGERAYVIKKKVGERAYVIKKEDFEVKIIVEHVKTVMGTYETHVYLKNEKTGDITFTRYVNIGGVFSVKEAKEVWVNPDKVIERGREIWVVDETSMMGSKEVKALLDAAEQAEVRQVIFVGDTKQLAAVEAGQIFKDMQTNGLNTITMTQKVRQKDEEYRKAVDALGKQDWETFKEKVDAKVKEIVDRKERLEAIKQDFLSGDPQKTLIVTARNADKNELNAQIREALKKQKKLKDGYVFTVRESKNLSAEEKRYAFSYSIGDTVFATKSDLKEMGIKSKSNEFTVVAVDYLRNTITIQNQAGKKFTIDIKKWGDKFSVYKPKLIEISKGDRVITLKNDRTLNIKNGEMWQVVKIDQNGNITIKNENKTITFNIFKDYNYIDYGYASTVHKAQGMTISKVIYDASATKTNYNVLYTAITRGKTEYSIYTDNKEVFYDRMRHEQFKTSTIELSKTSTEKSKTSTSVAKTTEQRSSTKSTSENELETSASYSRSR